MDSSTRAIVGGALAAGGLAAGGYLLYRHIRNQQQAAAVQDVHVDIRALNGQQIVPDLNEYLIATVTWLNPTDRPITFGVQGAVIQQPPIGDPDLVGGHWWVSRAALDQARSGTFAQDQFNPAMRVSRLTVPPGQRGSVEQWSHPRVVSGEEFWFWIVADPAPNRLLVSDATRTHKSALPQPRQILRIP